MRHQAWPRDLGLLHRIAEPHLGRVPRVFRVLEGVKSLLRACELGNCLRRVLPILNLHRLFGAGRRPDISHSDIAMHKCPLHGTAMRLLLQIPEAFKEGAWEAAKARRLDKALRIERHWGVQLRSAFPLAHNALFAPLRALAERPLAQRLQSRRSGMRHVAGCAWHGFRPHQCFPPGLNTSLLAVFYRRRNGLPQPVIERLRSSAQAGLGGTVQVALQSRHPPHVGFYCQVHLHLCGNRFKSPCQ